MNRRFPVYMCSNNVTIFNPYFDYFNVGVRLQSRTKFLRGDGWVLEQTFNEAAATAIKDNFHSMSEKELAYATENKYLLDDNQFVGDVPGRSRITRASRTTYIREAVLTSNPVRST